MKKGALMLGIAAAVLAMWGVLTSAAETVTLAGKVEVTKDDNGKVTAVSVITDDDDCYRVTLDEKGKELAEKMAGAKVKVTGTVAEKDDEAWLTVQTYEKVGGAE